MGPRRTYRGCGYQQLTGVATSTALTIPTSIGGNSCKPNAVLLQAETQALRYRDDGTAPTATVGMILQTGQAPFYYDGDLNLFRVIQSTAGAILNVIYLEDAGAT